jgi:hypothetical protein
MWRIGWIAIIAVASLISEQAASANALLFAAVEFDSTSKLYTYDYAVVNDTPSKIFQVNILVGNADLGTYSSGQILELPRGYTSPRGWPSLSTSYSGGIAGFPYDENGVFYSWFGGYKGSCECIYANVIRPGADAFGFSVTTPFAPTLDEGLNDFFLYGTEGIVAFGNVVVPDGADLYNPPPETPISTTLPLFAGGLGALVLFGLPRKRKARALAA